jgi:hypothetical protein
VAVVDAMGAMMRDLSKEMLRWKHMLQAYVLSVSDVLEVYFQLFHMNVAKVDRGCCTCCICWKCFRDMLQVF